ncbi:Ferric-chelate reductase 1 [Orchesella cincta]|uniref:ascorbate ferrireductase (transmembrane) n=1 Tax=Orchesella cincta TaxID=48709 RepID=A0A1D2MTW2_ORCCI|nr:Ferric-chelate reductase 1 [Orchesella cincta]
MPPFSFRGVVLTLLFLLGNTLSPSEYCVSQSPDELVINSICASIGEKEHGYYFSLGQQALYSSEAWHLHFRHNRIDSGNTELKYGGVLLTKVYAIKAVNKTAKTSRYLTGWLYGEVIVNNIPPNPPYKDHGNKDWGTITHLYAQMEDENGNAIGEFHHPEELCKGGDIVNSTIPDDLLTTCSQASPAALKVANAIVFPWHPYVKNTVVKEELWKFYQKRGEKPPTVYPVVWSFSHNSCDRPKKIRLRAYALTHLTGVATIRSNWISIKYVGASDILHLDEEVKCKEVQLLGTYQPDIVVPPIPWIKEVEPAPKLDYATTDKDIVRTKTICKTFRVPKTGGAGDFSKIPSFGGRCLTHNEYNTSNQNAHECPPETATDPDVVNYTKYSVFLENRRHCMGLDDCPCQCRPFQSTLIGSKSRPDCTGYIPSPPSTAPPGTILFIGYETRTPAGKSILQGRKVHGIAMTLVSMSFVPISITLARYFKETWLPLAHLQIVQVWYVVHVMATFFTLCLYLVGWIGTWRGTILLGHSWVSAAIFHRLLGTGTIVLFFLASVIGSLRPTVNSPFRKILIITHALLGIFYYLMGLITVILSQWIPGSPSSDETCVYLTNTWWANNTWRVLPFVVAWFVVDLIFHGVFTGYQCMLDKHAGYTRPMVFPLLSILKGGEEKGTKGGKLRSLLFIIYCVINGGIVFTLVGFIIASKDAGCGYGPTTCTHSDLTTMLPVDICNI